ncbi:MAG: AAA family ATPase [Candidatus Nomurabacteria bacterium]|nr:MAG: AAA family ATPase [Candidatus Nomurabacteria bacterium]
MVCISTRPAEIPKPAPKLIGLTGTLAAGKGAVSEYLIQKGYQHYSAREFIRAEIQKRGLAENRDMLVQVGNDLRRQFGPDYVIATMARRGLAESDRVIVESIRVPAEVEAVQKMGGVVIALDADQKLRYERLYKRGLTDTDNVTFAEFVAEEEREMRSDDPHKQNIHRCVAMADYRIENNGGQDELYQKVDTVLKKLEG